MSEIKAEIAVIGGGIIGVTSALELQRAGRSVVLIEPRELGVGTAAGSAGYLSDSHIFPIASAKTVMRIPQMLMDPLGPLVIRPAYAPRMIGWGLRFLSSLRPSRARVAISALASLNRDALRRLLELATAARAAEYLSREGALSVCLDDRNLREQVADLAVYRSYGINVREVTPSEISDLEPALAHDFIGGLFFPEEARCLDPGAFGRRLAASFVEMGGATVPQAVTAIEPKADGSWDVRFANGDAIRSESVIVSAGVWSRPLLERLGYTVPLETERGYHLMLPKPQLTVQRPVHFVERRFVATQMTEGLRLAGTAEFAGLDAPMDPRRSDVLYQIAAPYLPGLSNVGATRWMGYRPNLPDSLPAIGKSPRHRNLYYNFGHQHLGLTQSAASAHILTNIVVGNGLDIDIAPFSLDRFN
jgi:D-hydroxyproline dehydrogenase